MDVSLINQITGYIGDLGYWAWWIAAALLVIMEVLAPGAIFLWLGIAAVAMGGLVYFAPEMDWKLQLTIFAVLSVTSIAVLRRHFKPQAAQTDQPNLNQRGQGLIGNELVLSEAIINGQGRAHIGDSGWLVEGPDLPAGTHVRVVEVTGSSLQVVKIEEA